MLDELINNGEVTALQWHKFDFDRGFDHDDFTNLLAYMGFVSLQRQTLAGEVFSIPNHIMAEQCFQYLKEELERTDRERVEATKVE